MTHPIGPGLQLTQEQLDRISGGSCTATELVILFENFTQTYENLVNFTSHVIERVANSIDTTP